MLRYKRLARATSQPAGCLDTFSVNAYELSAEQEHRWATFLMNITTARTACKHKYQAAQQLLIAECMPRQLPSITQTAVAAATHLRPVTTQWKKASE
jgi:hypothetical protein